MVDVCSGSTEEIPVPQLLRDSGEHLYHVHVNDANKRGPGFGNTDFASVMRTLKGWTTSATSQWKYSILTRIRAPSPPGSLHYLKGLADALDLLDSSALFANFRALIKKISHAQLHPQSLHHEAVDVHAAVDWYKSSSVPPAIRPLSAAVRLGCQSTSVPCRSPSRTASLPPWNWGATKATTTSPSSPTTSTKPSPTSPNSASRSGWGRSRSTTATASSSSTDQTRQDRVNGAKLSGNPPLRPVAQPLSPDELANSTRLRDVAWDADAAPSSGWRAGGQRRARLPTAGGRSTRSQHRALGARPSRLWRR